MNDASTKSAAFYDSIAADYDRQMRGPGDARIRAAFWELVRAHVPKGATVLDFGCGTGIDAERHAATGYRVVAYDNSSAMVDVLRRRCAPEIRRGQVEAWSGPYEGFFEALRSRAPVDAVTANFAAVNHLPDARAWLEGLASHTAPSAIVVVSSLNACALEELARARFWRRGPKHLCEPGVPSSGDAYELVRYWPWALGRDAARFRVVAREGAGGLGGLGIESLERLAWKRWGGWLFGQFTFVVLRKVS